MPILLMLGWGCSGATTGNTPPIPDTGTPSGTGGSAHSGDSEPLTGPATGHTAEPHSAAPGDTSDSAAPTTQLVHFRVWESDRECWATRALERPIEYWEAYFGAGCQTADFPGPPYVDFDAYADEEGHCLTIHQGFGIPECELLDPFIRPCSEVPGCCDEARADDYFGQNCVPSAWEP